MTQPADVNTASETVAIARIVGGPLRSKAVGLTWPVQFGELLFESITVRRLTTGEVTDFVEAVQAQGEARLPMFMDGDGNPVPQAVMRALDPDDMDALNKVADDFLPRRLRGALATGSASETAGTSSPS